MTRTRPSLLLLPVLALALTACGSDSDALSKADYVSQADVICAELNEAGEALNTDLDPSDPTAVASAFQDISDQLGSASGRLSALEAPEDDAAELREKFTGPIEEQAAAFQGLADEVTTAVEAGEDGSEALAGIAELEDVATPDEAFLTSYGFQDCAEDAA